MRSHPFKNRLVHSEFALQCFSHMRWKLQSLICFWLTYKEVDLQAPPCITE